MGADDVPHHFLKGQAVLFIHRHEERREHDPQHEEHSPGAPDRPTGQQIGGDPHQSAASKTNELPLSEVEHQLGLDPGKVIGNIHIGYGRSLLSVPRHFWTRCPEAGVHSTSFPHTSQPPGEQLHPWHVAQEGHNFLAGLARLFAVGLYGGWIDGHWRPAAGDGPASPAGTPPRWTWSRSPARKTSYPPCGSFSARQRPRSYTESPTP